MAYVESQNTSKLILNVEVGATSNGHAKYAQRSFADMNPELGANDFGTIGSALADLQSYPVGAIVRQNTCVLVEE